MKFSTYTSLLTGRKTMFIAAYGKCGYANYKEIQITCENGLFFWQISNGYKLVTIGYPANSLKAALSLASSFTI